MFPEFLTYGRTGFADELMWGAIRTVEIAFFAYAFGLMLGLLGAAAKLYGNVVFRLVAGFYTTVIRSVPELVLILLFFFAGTEGLNQLIQSLGFEPVQINEMLAAIVVLGVVQGAYSTEVLRAAILAVPQGQIEAARAFGMSGMQVMRRIVGPVMLPNALPGLANLWLIVIKDTALIAVVGGSPELAQVTRNAAGFTKQYMMFYVVTAMIYLVIALCSNQLIDRLERRFRRGQQRLA
jgi:polar amino acid transport system permease protein